VRYYIDYVDEYGLNWTDNFPAEEKTWLADVVSHAYQARSGGNVAHIVSVYDKGEARAVDNFLKKLRAGK
jgi:hypothetical protein